MVFESVIKHDGFGAWLIELTDVETGESAICTNIPEYMDKVSQMGEAYGGNIEVQWSSDEHVLPEHINEIRQAMMKYEQEKGLSEESDQGGFNPNG